MSLICQLTSEDIKHHFIIIKELQETAVETPAAGKMVRSIRFGKNEVECSGKTEFRKEENYPVEKRGKVLKVMLCVTLGVTEFIFTGNSGLSLDKLFIISASALSHCKFVHSK